MIGQLETGNSSQIIFIIKTLQNFITLFFSGKC
jgi:hypothetical protein